MTWKVHGPLLWNNPVHFNVVLLLRYISGENNAHSPSLHPSDSISSFSCGTWMLNWIGIWENWRSTSCTFVLDNREVTWTYETKNFCACTSKVKKTLYHMLTSLYWSTSCLSQLITQTNSSVWQKLVWSFQVMLTLSVWCVGGLTSSRNQTDLLSAGRS